VTDEPNEDKKTEPPDDGTRTGRGGAPGDDRYFQQNLANRLFPGPSRRMSHQMTDHIEGLLKPLDDDTRVNAWRERQARIAAVSDGSRPARPAREGTGTPAAEPSSPARQEDIALVSETLEAQNELLRAMLASSVDTQTDARSTAQNSRTFAWAGTAIALLTLVATVIEVVAAVQGR
jgi:hypothetical protein